MGASDPRVVRLATRGSPLALAQAGLVSDGLAAASGGAIRAELVVVETSGDRAAEVPLHRVGGQGVFVKEVERAVLEGRADAAVHSAKDLPASPVPGVPALPIAAVPRRADPRDALVGCALGELRAGARVATGSVRRRAQLAWLRPGLTFAELRGNIGTRLGKVPPGGAAVVAMAALERLGWAWRAADVLSPGLMLPQVGQGALAVCTGPEDEETALALAALDDPPSRRALEAERAFLQAVGGGCELPVGAYATCAADGSIALEAMIASLDGHVVVRSSAVGAEPGPLGAEVADRLLVDNGGRSILDSPSVLPS